MHKSTLLELLRTFSKEELNRFDLFLRSPYFNTSVTAIRFFSLIRKFAPDFIHDNLKKETIWKAMFPDKVYNYGSMKNLIYLLTKLALRFVAQEYSEEKQISINSDMINSLMKRGTENLLSQKFNELEKLYTEGTLEGKGAKTSVEFYHDLSNIYWNKNVFVLSSQMSTPDEDLSLKESAYSICSILIRMTKSFNNLLTTSYVGNIKKIINPVALMMSEMHSGIIDRLMPLVKDISEREYRILNLYMKISKAQLNPGVVEFYKDFYRDFEECIDILPENDVKIILSLRSVLLSFIDEEKINTNFEAMEICKLMIRDKLFESDTVQLQAYTYYHYMVSAFMINDFEEIKVFSKKYLNRISGDLIENAESFTNALIAFGDKKFEECLAQISKLNYNFFLMKIEIKLLKAKCLYELNDYLMFENENKSLYHFLKNNKSLSLEVHSYLKKDFEMISKLFRFREKFDPHGYEMLKEKIMKSETYKNSWFAEKVISI